MVRVSPKKQMHRRGLRQLQESSDDDGDRNHNNAHGLHVRNNHIQNFDFSFGCELSFDVKLNVSCFTHRHVGCFIHCSLFFWVHAVALPLSFGRVSETVRWSPVSLVRVRGATILVRERGLWGFLPLPKRPINGFVALLVACTRLYNPLCLSVGRLVRRSHSISFYDFFFNLTAPAQMVWWPRIWPLPTRTRLW